MIHVATPRLRAALWLTALGVVAALAAGRPEPVAVAAPFALLVLIVLQQRRDPLLEGVLRLEADRVREGDEIPIELEIGSGAASKRLEIDIAVPPGLSLDRDGDGAVAVEAGQPRTVRRSVTCHRWGAYSIGRVTLRRYDRLRLVADERELGERAALRVYPPVQALRALVRALETQPAVGDHVSRERGDGIELAELRPFVSGDEPRRVNWRATARTGELVVNELHPERSTDIVLFVDATADEGSAGATPLDQSVRAAAALAERYLTRRDRVALLVVGGAVRWLRPARGAAQLHRIFDTLIESRGISAPADDRRAIVIPTRAIPSKALVLAVSPLVDDAVVRALLSLRGRGYDIAVVEISPLSYAALDTDETELAARFLRLERGLLRAQIRSRGIAVVEWEGDAPLEGTIRALEEYRRRARVVNA